MMAEFNLRKENRLQGSLPTAGFVMEFNETELNIDTESTSNTLGQTIIMI